MSQPEQPHLNRAQRRKLDQEIKRAVKTGVGVDARLAGYRVVRADGSVRYAAGKQPDGSQV